MKLLSDSDPQRETVLIVHQKREKKSVVSVDGLVGRRGDVKNEFRAIRRDLRQRSGPKSARTSKETAVHLHSDRSDEISASLKSSQGTQHVRVVVVVAAAAAEGVSGALHTPNGVSFLDWFTTIDDSLVPMASACADWPHRGPRCCTFPFCLGCRI